MGCHTWTYKPLKVHIYKFLIKLNNKQMKYLNWIIIGIVCILCLSTCGTYNSMVSKQEKATKAFADIDAACQRRADLLPNLTKVVKAYAKHEKETFTEVAAARAAASQIKVDPENLTPEKLAEFQKAQGQLSAALGKLMVVSEKYPELKANENFRDLQTQLEGTENRINYARQKYNEAVQSYNISIRTFPSVIFANMFGFDKMEMFKAQAEAEKAPNLDI
jgi:LemA protein